MFLLYFCGGVVALIVAVLTIGPRLVFDPRRIIGWYLVVLTLTYILRPMIPDVRNNSDVYDHVGIVGFSAVAGQMTVALVASLLFLAIGYRLGSRRGPSTPDAPVEPANKRKLTVVALAIIVWGYGTGVLFPGDGAVENLQDRQYAVNSGQTAYLTESIQFASTGATALYILTGNLLPSLAITAPWFMMKVSKGWSRVALIAYFASLICVLVVNWGRRFWVKSYTHGAMLVIGALFAILVFLPAAGAVRVAQINFLELSGAELKTALLRNFDTNDLAHTARELSGFESTVYMLETRHPPTWGTYYVYFYLIKPIPRVLWTGKPLPPDLAEWIFGIPEDTRYFGLAGGAIGDALFAWGWLGIPLEFIFTGWAFRRLEFRCVDRRPTTAALLAYAGFFSLLPQLGRDGFIHMVSERWLFVYGGPALLFWYFETYRSKAPDVIADLKPAVKMRRLVGQG